MISTHPTSVYEINYTSLAAKKRVPIFGIIKSFDNITSKGFMPVMPNYVSVWNKQMQEELIKIHSIKNKLIHISGAPQFDIYKNFSPKNSVNFAKNGLSGKKKIVLLTLLVKISIVQSQAW